MKIERDEIIGIICSVDEETIGTFTSRFKNEMEQFVDVIVESLNQFDVISLNYNGEERMATILLYLFNGIRLLINAFHLLFMGYLIAAGNLMRQSMESINMAILMSIPQSEYVKFKRKGTDYKVNYASARITAMLDDTRISREAWDNWIEIETQYNLSSHPTAFALSECYDFHKHSLAIEPLYDVDKEIAYLKEIDRMINVAQNLGNIFQGILPNK